MKNHTKVLQRKSPLALIDRQILNRAIKQRTNSNEPINEFLKIAQILSEDQNDSAKTRAEFIVRQCNGERCYEYFEKHQESWGIPNFQDHLVTVNEFKNGFLWTMKDYTTAFEENHQRVWSIINYLPDQCRWGGIRSLIGFFFDQFRA